MTQRSPGFSATRCSESSSRSFTGWRAELKEAVETVYEDFLQYAEELADITRERKKQKVFYALQGFTDEAVWAEIERRKSGAQPEQKSIKQAEIETLLSSPATLGEDTPDGDFYARARDLDTLPSALRERLSRIVLVHRLREVMALVGFTRFEPPVPDIDGDLSLPVEVAPLAREAEWVPATENRGEGVFLAFSDEAIKKWQQQPGVAARGKRLAAGFVAWRQRREIPAPVSFPGLPYIMLQSLAHLLITAVSLEAGVVITDTTIARMLRVQLDILVEHGELRQVPGIGPHKQDCDETS
jgi:hypothetical protein